MTLALIPHRAVILGLDPATVSGWALVAPERGRCALLDSGIAKTPCDRESVVAEAVDAATRRSIPLIVVAEDWPSGAFPNTTAYGAVREAWGRWDEHFEVVPRVRVHAATWRAGLGVRAKGRDAWKEAAATAVRLRFGIRACADEAEAVCIAVWGAHAGEVAARLAKPERKRRPVAHAAPVAVNGTAALGDPTEVW